MEQHYPSSRMTVPFTPPRSQLCGSTSIEMVASYWQSTTAFTPNLTLGQLDERTLIPAKGGTLQMELMSAARAEGLIAYPIEPTFDALFSELGAHHPVIVLLNRSFSWHPLWHYAPVIGYEAQQRSLIAHFSDQPNEAISLATFGALWKRSGNWGVVLLPPGELPASVSSGTFLRAVYAYGKSGDEAGSILAYEKGVARWPGDLDLLFALANGYYALSRFLDAEERYRQILSLKPSHPLALNNLATLLCRSGRGEEASMLMKRAFSDEPAIASILKSTRKEIETGCRAPLN